jgi:hypothetical protein
MVDFIKGTLRRSDRCIRLTLKKALREPWPQSFSEKPKWDVDCLSEWKQSPIWYTFCFSSELRFHVACSQHQVAVSDIFRNNTFEKVYFPEPRLTPPLEIVRDVIGTILRVFEEGVDNFLSFNIDSVRLRSFSSSTKEPEFAFLAHRPLLLSPCGSPMLLISVLDCLFSKKLVEKGHLNAKEASEYLDRVFVKKNIKPEILYTTHEGTKLLRYLLRLNSTKMKPSSWQENNLSLGKYSPFLATYISPLYREKYVENLFDSSNSM